MTNSTTLDLALRWAYEEKAIRRMQLQVLAVTIARVAMRDAQKIAERMR